MSSQAVSSAQQPVVMRVAHSDIAPLFLAKARCNALSPFAKETPNGAAPSAELEPITTHPLFGPIRHVLTSPDLQINHRLADFESGMTVFSAYLSKSYGPKCIVILFPAPNDSFLIRVCSSLEEYLYWWLALLATKTERPADNLIGEQMPMESLIYIMHAIDSHKRMYYKAALNFDEDDSPFVSTSEFSESLLQAMSQPNLSWLLSSFMRATPELNQCQINPRPEHFEPMMRLDVMQPGTVNTEPVFVFGEAGRRLGLEFRNGWNLSMGLSAAVPAGNSVATINRCYLAPTHSTNHLFELLPGPQQWIATHSVLTFSALLDRCIKMIEDGLKYDSAKAAAEASQAAVAAAASAVASAAAAGKPAWRKLTSGEVIGLGRNLLQTKRQMGVPDNALRAYTQLFKLRDRAGKHWCVSMPSLHWHMVENNQWVKGEPPEEFWMEELSFQSLCQEMLPPPAPAESPPSQKDPNVSAQASQSAAQAALNAANAKSAQASAQVSMAAAAAKAAPPPLKPNFPKPMAQVPGGAPPPLPRPGGPPQNPAAGIPAKPAMPLPQQQSKPAMPPAQQVVSPAPVLPNQAAANPRPAQPLFCTNCGNKLKPQDKFCSSCATPVN
jgi:hypothetical protein